MINNPEKIKFISKEHKADVDDEYLHGVETGILVFKILDLIMEKDIHKKMYPLPKVKQ